jgi:hypothetical protein
MRLSNAQLRIVARLVAREARENPSVEADVLVERLVRMAHERHTVRPSDLLPPELVDRPERSHPLLG